MLKSLFRLLGIETSKKTQDQPVETAETKPADDASAGVPKNPLDPGDTSNPFGAMNPGNPLRWG